MAAAAAAVEVGDIANDDRRKSSAAEAVMLCIAENGTQVAGNIGHCVPTNLELLLVTQTCVTSQDWDSINYLLDLLILLAFVRRQKIKDQPLVPGKFGSQD